jgi:hypothetical protein
MTAETVSALLAESEKHWSQFNEAHPTYRGHIPDLEQMLMLQYQLRRAMELESWPLVADVITQLNERLQLPESMRRRLVVGNATGVRDEAAT